MDPDTGPTCDVVLKGGITSGVVYPTLLCELAGRYRLVNIGGASAGAIAAALAAAAEYGRQHGRGGYDVLADLPRRLGARTASGDTALAALFEPQARTRPLLAVLRAAQRGGVVRAAVAGLGAELRSASWWRVLLPAVPGALVGLAAALGAREPWTAVLAVLGLLLAVVGLVAGTGWALARRVLVDVPANHLGLVDGTGSSAALTPWLTRTIEEAAGRSGGPPLTLADLWGATDAATARACLEDADRRRINLEVMTTDLGEGRPQRLPAPTDEWFFREDEFRGLFDGAVVDAMVAVPDAGDREHRLLTLLARAQGFHRLPRAELPVVVAARLSLSFPVLVSAVPLYKVDFSRAESARAVAEWRAWLRAHPDVDLDADPATGLDPAAGPRLPLSRSWIADGGITANLPVHFFDVPLPKRPTFLVTLRPAVAAADRPDVALAADNQQGLQGARTGLGDAPPTLPGFLAAIVRTMLSWVENAQVRMPGYRDRIVTVYLGPGEGGANLQMPAELIDTLAGRGARAAGLLVERFADPPATGWHNHRWVRFRSLMAMLEPLAARSARAWTADPGVPVPTYARMLADADDPPSYRFPARTLPWVRARAGEVVELAAHWPDPVEDARGRPVTGSFEDGAPRPRPVWRAEPDL